MRANLYPILNVSLGYDNDAIGASGADAPTAEFQFRLADPAPEQSCRLVPGESPIYENLAERYAAKQDFAKALDVGLYRRMQGFSDPKKKLAWDLKVAAWAEAAGELNVALKIYLRDQDPDMQVKHRITYVKPGYEEGFARLQSDPKLWIEAARRKIAAGELLEAEPFLKEANSLNIFTLYRRKDLLNPDPNDLNYPRFILSHPGGLGSLEKEKALDGSPNLVRLKAGVDRDPAIDAEIEGLRQEIASAKADIADRFIQEINALEVKSQKALPKAREAISARRDQAWSYLGIIQELDKLPIAHFNAKPWIERAKVKLASSYFYGDAADGEEAGKIFRLLQRYSELEKRKQGVFDTFVQFYPSGSSYVFVDEIAADAKDLNEWLPNTKLVRESQILKTLQRLDGKSQSETGAANPALAAFAHETLRDLKASVDFKEEREDNGLPAFADYFNLKATGFTENQEQVPDLAALEAFVAKRERLYGGREAALFYQEIIQDEIKEKIANNENYRVRQQVEESLKTLKEFDHSERLLKRLEQPSGWNIEQGAPGWFEIPLDGKGPVALSFKALDEFPLFLLHRGTVHREFLEGELQRAKKLDDAEELELAKKLDGMECQDRAAIGPYNRYREAQAKESLERFDREFLDLQVKLSQVKLGGLKGGAKAILQVFHQVNDRVAAWEHDGIRSLLGRELSLLKEAGASASRLEPIERALSEAGSEDAYRQVKTKIEVEALRSEVEGRVNAYAQMEKEVHLTDRIGEKLDRLGSFLPLTDSDWNWSDRFQQVRPHGVVKKKYQAILDQINSGNPAQFEEAVKSFQRLNGAAIHTSLYEAYSDASTFNRAVATGVFVTAVAGIAAGLTALFVEAIGGGAFLAGAANAVVFTLSSRVARGAVYDGWDGVGSAFHEVAHKPLGFAEETLLNAAMFKAIGLANHGYRTAFAAAAEQFAVDRLTEQGLLLTLTPAAQQEMAQMGLGLGGELLKHSGAFANEVTVFQVWNFALKNYSLAKESRFDPIAAAKEAFSPEAWWDGVSFLGALKTVNLVGMIPPFSWMNAFLAGKVEERQRLYGDDPIFDRLVFGVSSLEPVP